MHGERAQVSECGWVVVGRKETSAIKAREELDRPVCFVSLCVCGCVCMHRVSVCVCVCVFWTDMCKGEPQRMGEVVVGGGCGEGMCHVFTLKDRAHPCRLRAQGNAMCVTYALCIHAYVHACGLLYACGAACDSPARMMYRGSCVHHTYMHMCRVCIHAYVHACGAACDSPARMMYRGSCVRVHLCTSAAM